MMRFGSIFVFAWLCAAGGIDVVQAQTTDALAGVSKEIANVLAVPGAATGPPPATLRVFNRPIVTFRVSILGMPPSERAQSAVERIGQILDQGGKDAVSAATIAQGVLIRIGERSAFMIVPGDIHEHVGETIDGKAAEVVLALRQVIAETREARDGQQMLANGLWAGGVTLVFAGLLWLLWRFGRFVTRSMLRFAGAKVHKLRVGGVALMHRERVTDVVQRALRAGYWLLVLLLTYEWLGLVLERFPFTRPWGEGLNTFLIQTGTGILIAIAHSVPDLLVVVVIFVLARAAGRGLNGFFDGVQSGRVHVRWVDVDSARPTRRLASFAVWLFAIAMAYPYIPGSDTDAFKGLSVLFGLMVSMGASGLVGQAASGLILMFTRTYRPGEFVRIGDNEGTITGMGTFTTQIRTGLGEELTLPNSMVMGTVIKNYSRTVQGRGFILDSAVTIGYDAPWRQVHAMLIEAATRTEGILDNPPPRVFQTARSDYYVEYRLVCQAVPAEPRPRAEVLSALHCHIQDVFNEHGVQIMSPHYVTDPSAAKIVPQGKWYEPPAARPEPKPT